MKGLVKKSVKSFLNHNNPVTNAILLNTGYVQRRLLPTSASDESAEFFSKGDLQRPGEQEVWGNGLENAASIKDLNSVAGYVPFEKNRTSIVIYNFFGKNYAIRKQLLGSLHYIRNSEVQQTKFFLMPTDKVLEIDDTIHGDVDADYVIVQLFHQRLPKGHGGHNGHLRFWGVYSNHAATVHSMPVPATLLKKANIRSSRRYIPSMISTMNRYYELTLTSLFSTKRYNANDLSTLGDLSEKQIGPLGFNILAETFPEQDEATIEKDIHSVWHDSAFHGIIKDQQSTQLVPLPDVSELDVILNFVEAIPEKMNLTLYLFSAKNELLKTKVCEADPAGEISLLREFGNALPPDGYALVAFEEEKADSLMSYINLHYCIGQKICDNVHAHHALMVMNVDNKSLGRHYFRGPQALKFMHFPNQEKFQSTLSVWCIAPEFETRIRIIMADGAEYVLNKKIEGLGLVNISVRDLLNELGISNNQHGVVQLECKTGNPHGNVFNYSKEQQTLAVDHLTGG